MKFRTRDQRIEQVFSEKNIYEVPNFQRDFSWQEKQYKDFISDIKKNLSLSVNGGKIVFKSEITDYFFGTILIVGDETKASVENPYKVIDGQQRLTTMTLFLTCIKDIIDSYNDKLSEGQSYSHDYDSNLFFSHTSDGNSTLKIRLVNKNLNPILPYDILKLEPHDASNEKTTNASQETLRNAFHFIKNQLSQECLLEGVIKKGSDFQWDMKEYIRYIDYLGKQLLNSTVICIYSVDEKDVNKIYQNFNSKGLRLSDIDLIKSRIFEVLHDDYDETSRKWNYITDTIYKIDESISDFFYYYFNSRGIKTSQTNLFQTFSNKIKETDYSSFLDDCSKYIDFYRVICSPNENDLIFKIENYFNQDNNYIVKENLLILKTSGYSQFRMAFLSLFNAMNDGRMSGKQFKSIIDLITKYNVLNSIKASGDGSKTNKSQSIYRKMSVEFNKEVINTDSLNNQLKKDLRSLAPRLDSVKKSDKVFDKGNKIKSKVDKKARDLSKYILITLETEKMIKERKNTANKSLKFLHDLSIEHIIDREQQNEIGNIVYDIGNLVLLENAEHTNSKDKKKMYKNSKLYLIKDIRGEIDKFSTESIKARHNELLEEFYKIVTR